MKRSIHYTSCPRVFSERLKKALCERIDQFIKETPNQGRTDKEWLEIFKKWSKLKR